MFQLMVLVFSYVCSFLSSLFFPRLFVSLPAHQMSSHMPVSSCSSEQQLCLLELVISSCWSFCGFFSCRNYEKVCLTLHFSVCQLDISSHHSVLSLVAVRSSRQKDLLKGLSDVSWVCTSTLRVFIYLQLMWIMTISAEWAARRLSIDDYRAVILN